MSETIHYCQCCGLTFVQIDEYARRKHITSMKQLRRDLHMGAYCNVCRPYLRRMFQSGRAECVK